jgi:cysteine-rich repeat protein
MPGDGCTPTCTLEPGWQCFATTCSTICGDGKIVGDEQCDDANQVSNDGCSSACTIQQGWTCTGSPSQCTKPGGQPVTTQPAASSTPQITVTTSATPQPQPVIAPASQVPESRPASSAQAVAYRPAALSDTVTMSSAAVVYSMPAPAPNIAPALASSSTPSTDTAVQTQPLALSQTDSSAPDLLLYVVRSSSPPSEMNNPQNERYCGNGLREIGEECDLGTQNSDAASALCRSNCSVAKCGDGIADPPYEQCDMGSANSDVPGAPCTRQCRIPSAPLAVTAPTSPVVFEKLIAQSVDWPPSASPYTQVPTVTFLPTVTSPLPPQIAASGPGSLAVMATGAAAGIGWVRRRRRQSPTSKLSS